MISCTVPGDPSVDRSSLAEGLGDFLATLRVNTGDGRVLVTALNPERVAVIDSEGESVGGSSGAVRIRHQLAPRLDRRLSLPAERRVIHLRPRVRRESLEPGYGVEVLMLAAAEVRGAAAGVVVVVHVGQG